MKQLLLNSLFVVGSAFIYIQCIKLFTTHKLPEHQLQNEVKIQKASYNKQNNAALVINDKSAAKSEFKNKIINPFFNNPDFPFNMMVYINYHSLFYNPTIGLNYYDLVHKYKGRSQPNKR